MARRGNGASWAKLNVAHDKPIENQTIHRINMCITFVIF
jgi:hypothetical protein